MKKDYSFIKQLLLVLAALCAAGAYPLYALASAGTAAACAAGALLATLNAIAGFAAIEFSVGKSMNTFLKYVLGGMGIRMALLAAALFASIKIAGLDPAALVGSLGLCYVAFLALEIVFIQKRLGVRRG